LYLIAWHVAQEERTELPGGMSVVEWLVGSSCSERRRCLGEKRRAMEERLDELEVSDSEAMSLAEQLGEGIPMTPHLFPVFSCDIQAAIFWHL
jgi:hypothetical protein